MESRTIFGFPYREDDRVISITAFIAEHLTHPGVEIEAKVGSFRFKNESFAVPHILEIDSGSKAACFESSLQPLMFYSLLDSLKACCKDFVITETEDHLYTCSDRDSKIRQSVSRTGEVLSVIKKTRLADKNFVLNSGGLGLRVSANLEENLESLPENSKFSIMRKKKRFAFRYSYLEIDMTEVIMNNKASFELEIEIVDFNFVRSHVENFNSGKDKGSLIGISRKIWQNALALAFHKPKATVFKTQENSEIIKARDDAYGLFIGEVRPLIGDYLYCCALEKGSVEMAI
jgi:hypothetical protein